VITPTLILPHQGGGEFFRELDAPQLCCGVLHWRNFAIGAVDVRLFGVDVSNMKVGKKRDRI
jgi:hypothetical protein